MYKFLITLLFTLKAFSGAAQEDFLPPQAKTIAKFPFIQLTGGVILLKATIDTLQTDSLHFILDTGSGGISLDSATVEKCKFISVPTERTIRGIAGTKKVHFTYGHYLNFPGLKTDTFSFHINNYDLLSSVYGVKIDGIIGFSFLRKYILKINFDETVLEVLTPGYIKYPKGGLLLKPQFTNLPYISFFTEDTRNIWGKYIFDSGAGLTLLLSKDFVTDSLQLIKKNKIYTTQAEGLGGKKSMEFTVLKSMQIGPYKFKKVPVYIFEDENNITAYPQVFGIIGNDILRRFNLIVNYPEQTIHLKPNTKFNEGFDYSYTGLGIYAINNEPTVTDVIENSPAAKAGFKPGDVIIAIDKVFTKNIQTVKTALQHAGNKLNILVMRNKMPVLLVLHVKNILHK
jgi:hypothetical protein